MARRKSTRGSKIQPAVQTMVFPLPIGEGQSSYVDLSQVASLMNRRFYRQGINWAVAGIKILTPSGTTGEVTISKLPNTWIMSNAWEKGFRAWQRMNNEAMSEGPSVRPKFMDYKIYADEGHHSLGYVNNLLPLSLAGIAQPGEWESSKMIIPDSSAAGTVKDVELIAVGANYPPAGASGLRAVSLIEGYANSRGLPNILDPNTPDDADDTAGPFPQNWITAVFNDGTEQSEEVLDDLTSENNLAPYPFENDGVNGDTMYPGGANQLQGLQIHDSAYLTSTTIGGSTHLKGGNFPCGLIKISTDVVSPSGLTPILYVDLVPGNHRGYLCEPMTEM